MQAVEAGRSAAGASAGALPSTSSSCRLSAAGAVRVPLSLLPSKSSSKAPLDGTKFWCSPSSEAGRDDARHCQSRKHAEIKVELVTIYKCNSKKLRRAGWIVKDMFAGGTDQWRESFAQPTNHSGRSTWREKYHNGLRTSTFSQLFEENNSYFEY